MDIQEFWGSLPRGVWEILIAEVVDLGNDLLWKQWAI